MGMFFVFTKNKMFWYCNCDAARVDEFFRRWHHLVSYTFWHSLCVKSNSNALKWAAQ